MNQRILSSILQEYEADDCGINRDMDTTTQTPKKVIVYSTASCHYCHLLKDYLTEKGIAFDTVDVGVDMDGRRAALEKSGQLGVPVTDIGGDIVVGFDQERVDQLLGITN